MKTPGLLLVLLCLTGRGDRFQSQQSIDHWRVADEAGYHQTKKKPVADCHLRRASDGGENSPLRRITKNPVTRDTAADVDDRDLSPSESPHRNQVRRAYHLEKRRADEAERQGSDYQRRAEEAERKMMLMQRIFNQQLQDRRYIQSENTAHLAFLG